jgi:hypothetical protein
MASDPPPTCLRPTCTRPTVYGSPACGTHWQAWRDAEQARIAEEWDLDRVPSEVAQEQEWLQRRAEERLQEAIEREGRFAQDIRDAAEG